jgi:hypothetical protein
LRIEWAASGSVKDSHVHLDHRQDAHPDELTRKLVTVAYARFCAQHAVHPSELAAKRFALEVTESDARAYHGLDSAALERLLNEHVLRSDE